MVGLAAVDFVCLHSEKSFKEIKPDRTGYTQCTVGDARPP